VACSSQELPGLTARLDKLCYHHGGASLPADKPHAFVYFITIHNASDRTVTLLGRKWVILHADGTRLVIEGDKIVGETPRLAPGEQFSYNSYHVSGCDARAEGSFHGVDDLGRKTHVLLPPFEMTVRQGNKIPIRKPVYRRQRRQRRDFPPALPLRSLAYLL
jgi:ApaG protein